MECRAAPSIGFTRERLATLERIEREHFWFVGRRILVQDLLAANLPKRRCTLLDLGCGTGAHVAHLLRAGHCAIGMDLRPEGLHTTRIAWPRAPLARTNAARLPLRSGSLDAVTMLDILEHVDDHATLGEVCRLLRRGAIAVITVPALPALWSFRDEAAGHLRRYTKTTLRAVIRGAGLQVVEVRYYQFLLLPLVAVSRWLGRHRSIARDHEDHPPAWLNAVLRWVNRIDARGGKHIRWPIGSSLVALCRKVAA